MIQRERVTLLNLSPVSSCLGNKRRKGKWSEGFGNGFEMVGREEKLRITRIIVCPCQEETGSFNATLFPLLFGRQVEDRYKYQNRERGDIDIDGAVNLFHSSLLIWSSLCESIIKFIFYSLPSLQFHFFSSLFIASIKKHGNGRRRRRILHLQFFSLLLVSFFSE